MSGYVKINGTWHAFGQNAKGVFTRVGGVWRQVSNGHVNVGGSWHRFYFSDGTGPAAPTSYYSDFVNNGQCRVAWNNPSDADFSYMHVECYIPGQSAAVVAQNIAGSPGGAGQAINTAYNPYYVAQAWYLTPYDTNGNAGTTVSTQSMGFTGVARGRTPSPITINPVGSMSWNDGDGVSAQVPHNATFPAAYSSGSDSYRPAAGFSSGMGVAKGAYYYGNQFWDLLRGANITGYSVALEFTASGPIAETMYGMNTPNGYIPFTVGDSSLWGTTALAQLSTGSTDFGSVSRIGYQYVAPGGIASSINAYGGGQYLTALAFYSNYPANGAGGGYLKLYRAWNEGGYYVRSGAWSISHDG